MQKVRAKKSLGQHFLKDQNIAIDIVEALQDTSLPILEIGPGMGVLTQYLLKKTNPLKVIELDHESVEYLSENYLELEILQGDFLRTNLSDIYNSPFAIIGNFPYNISSQILFKLIDYRQQIPLLVGMFQREVALRVAAKPRTKDYGILSVILQAWYDIEYLFTVDEHVFNPPPKVKSAVIRLKRNNIAQLPCDEKLFVKVIKAGFNQRRKMLRNALQSICDITKVPEKYLTKRAEELSVNDFADLTNAIDTND